MAIISKTLWNTVESYYNDFYDILYSNADPRTKDWLFMQRLDGVIALTVAYVAFTVLGPRFMANRKALDLKWPMFAYNVAMTGFAFWLFLELVTSTWSAGYNYLNDSMLKHSSFDPRDVRVAGAMWWYFASKPVEFLDTIFMVLKKKNSQISVLHVWHHSYMFPFLFIATLMAPGGTAIVAQILNCLVHTVMYAYYGLSLFPTLQPYLGWKKYLTQMQLIQFFLIMFQTGYAYWSGCDYPAYLFCAGPLFYTSLVVLFSNFYIQAYLKRLRRSSSKSDSKDLSMTKKKI